SDGRRFEGTGAGVAAAASACCSEATRPSSWPVVAVRSGAAGAPVVVGAASGGGAVASGAAAVVAVVAGAPVTVGAGATGASCGAAAAWPPSNDGVVADSPHAAVSPTRIIAAPRARLRAGTAASQRLWRTGSSTNRNDNADRPTAIAMATTR